MLQTMQVVWSHPRSDSVTALVAKTIINSAQQAQLQVTELDLYRRNFVPTMFTDDEPDWTSPHKVYSAEVNQLAQQLLKTDVLVMVFPLWWSSLPAMLKGYIDRVWNKGIAYGDGITLPIKKVRWVALTGTDPNIFIERGHDVHLSGLLNTRIAEYCGVQNSEIEFIHDVNGSTISAEDKAAFYETILIRAAGFVSCWLD